MFESEGFPQDYDFPEWDETGELESVPGFGFLPLGVNDELNLMTQVKTNTISQPWSTPHFKLSLSALIKEVSWHRKMKFYRKNFIISSLSLDPRVSLKVSVKYTIKAGNVKLWPADWRFTTNCSLSVADNWILNNGYFSIGKWENIHRSLHFFNFRLMLHSICHALSPPRV